MMQQVPTKRRRPAPSAVRVFTIPSMGVPPDPAIWKARVHWGFAIILLLQVASPRLAALLSNQPPPGLFFLWLMTFPLVVIAWAVIALIINPPNAGFRRRAVSRSGRINRLTHLSTLAGVSERLPHRMLELGLLGINSLSLRRWEPAIRRLPPGVCVIVGSRPTEWLSLDRSDVAIEPIEWPRDQHLLSELAQSRGILDFWYPDDEDEFVEQSHAARSAASIQTSATSIGETPTLRGRIQGAVATTAGVAMWLMIAGVLLSPCLYGSWYVLAQALRGQPTPLAVVFSVVVFVWALRQRVRRRKVFMPATIVFATEWPWTTAKSVVVFQAQATSMVCVEGSVCIANDDRVYTLNCWLGLTIPLIWRSTATQPDAIAISTYFHGARIDGRSELMRSRPLRHKPD